SIEHDPPLPYCRILRRVQNRAVVAIVHASSGVFDACAPLTAGSPTLGYPLTRSRVSDERRRAHRAISRGLVTRLHRPSHRSHVITDGRPSDYADRVVSEALTAATGGLDP